MKFWEVFYWIVTFVCIGLNAGVVFWGLEVSLKEAAAVGLFAATMAAHARARQEGTHHD